jgi:hypothetical protein
MEIAIISFLLVVIVLLCWMLKITTQERNSNEEILWKITKENYELINKLHEKRHE